MLFKALFLVLLLWLIFRAARNLLVAATGGVPSRAERMANDRDARVSGVGSDPGKRRSSGREGARGQEVEDAVWEDLP